jgi:hypothetical protein
MSFRISSGLSTTNIARSFNVAVAKTPSIPYVPKYWVSDWFELLLKKISLNKLGPTVATRWLYMSCLVAYITHTNLLQKIKLL